MRCDSNFNFKKKFRKHVREQHAKKSADSSSLSINTAKSVCESEKSSAVTCSSDSSISQESEIPTATPKQIFESMISETVTSLKYSHFTFSAFETVSELMKNTSIQCSFISSRSSFSQTFESGHQESSVQKFSEFCSFFSIVTAKSVCEIEKKSTVIEAFILQASHISFTTLEIISSVCLNFPIATSEIMSRSMKSASNREVTCARIICKLCKQNFNFNRKLYEHIRNHEAQQFVKNSHFSINAVNSLCEVKKTSFTSHKLSASSMKFQRFIFEFATTFTTLILLKRSNLSSPTFEIRSESTKRSTTCRRCNQIFNFNNKFHEHIREHHARKPVGNLNFRVLISEFTYKIIEKLTDIRSPASLTSQKSSILFATSTSMSESISSKCSHLSIATFNITSKSMKKLSVNSFTSSISSSRTSVSKHQKSYFTIDDLIRMFHEKFKSFDLRQHHNHFSFSQSIDARSSVTYQFRIIAYFLSTINQKTSIDQDLKSSNSKSLNQHMPAKSIRIVFSEILSEKSIKLSYKLPDVFCINFKSQIETFFFIFIFFRLFSVFFLVFAFVSVMFAARMSCISVCQQVISIIDRVNIELVVSGRN